MIESIQQEKDSILSNNPEDARCPILERIQARLQREVDDYQHLKIKDSSAFITQSIEAIHQELTNDTLHQLTDQGVVHPFVSFIRKLLEPVSWLIQKLQGQAYRPNFFAGSTEKNVATSAKTALNSLNNELTAIMPVDAPVSIDHRSQ